VTIHHLLYTVIDYLIEIVVGNFRRD